MTRGQIRARVASMCSRRIPASEIARVLGEKGALSTRTKEPLTPSGIYAIITSLREEGLVKPGRKKAKRRGKKKALRA